MPRAGCEHPAALTASSSHPAEPGVGMGEMPTPRQCHHPCRDSPGNSESAWRGSGGPAFLLCMEGTRPLLCPCTLVLLCHMGRASCNCRDLWGCAHRAQSVVPHPRVSPSRGSWRSPPHLSSTTTIHPLPPASSAPCSASAASHLQSLHAATPPERSPDLWSSILCLSDLSAPLPTTFPHHFFPPASRAEPRAGRRAGLGRFSGCPCCTYAASPHPPSCLCVRVAPSEQENPRTGRRGALNHSPGAGERGRRGERVAWGEDMPPPHSQLGTVDFIYLFYSEIYQTWDWSLPEPGVCGTNPGPTYHLPKCNYQMR